MEKQPNELYRELDALIDKNCDDSPAFADKLHIAGCLQAELNDLFHVNNPMALRHELRQIAAIAIRGIGQIRAYKMPEQFNCRG